LRDRITRSDWRNFLIVEGRLLASGGHGQLTAAEWLYLIEEAEDALVGAQSGICLGLAERIRTLHPKLCIDVAL